MTLFGVDILLSVLVDQQGPHSGRRSARAS